MRKGGQKAMSTSSTENRPTITIGKSVNLSLTVLLFDVDSICCSRLRWSLECTNVPDLCRWCVYTNDFNKMAAANQFGRLRLFSKIEKRNKYV